MKGTKSYASTSAHEKKVVEYFPEDLTIALLQTKCYSTVLTRKFSVEVGYQFDY